MSTNPFLQQSKDNQDRADPSTETLSINKLVDEIALLETQRQTMLQHPKSKVSDRNAVIMILSGALLGLFGLFIREAADYNLGGSVFWGLTAFYLGIAVFIKGIYDFKAVYSKRVEILKEEKELLSRINALIDKKRSELGRQEAPVAGKK